MSEYIRKQDVVDYCKALMNAELVQNTDDWGYGKERYNQTEVILEFIENRQPADVAPVIHGKWLPIVSYNNTYKCSECGRLLVNITDGLNVVAKHYPYCHCGAKMDGEE